MLPEIDAAAAKSDDAKARRKALSQKTIFGGSLLGSYSHSTSLAVGIFTRVNDLVAAEAKTYEEPEVRDRISKKIGSDTTLKPMVEYVEKGTGGPSSAVQEVRKVAKDTLDKRFDQHRGVIERGYQAEQATVAMANAEPPARKAAADAQMNIILARMKLSLQSMNDEKEALFK